MKFLIITHVDHIKNDNQYFGYAPYVREMNSWLKYVDQVIIVGSLVKRNSTAIDISYDHDKTHFIKIFIHLKPIKLSFKQVLITY